MELGLLIAKAEPGGLLRVNGRIAIGLAGAGHSVTLISATDGTAPECLADEHTGAFEGLGASRSVMAFPRLRQLFARDFDAIVVSQFFLGVVAVLARPRSSRTAIVWVEHSSIDLWRKSDRWKDRLAERLARLLCGRVEAMAAVARETVTAMNRQFRALRADAVFLPNPVLDGDEPIFTGTAGSNVERRGFVFVGRLSPEKRVHDIISAYAQIATDVPDDLHIIGDGAERPRLVAQAQRLGIEDRVHFLGHQPDPRSLMPRYRALVLASEFEGLGVVIVEALSQGCAVVATNCPTGPSELLAGGRFGRLVPVGDVAALRTAMRAASTEHYEIHDDLVAHLREFTLVESVAAYESVALAACVTRQSRLRAGGRA